MCPEETKPDEAQPSDLIDLLKTEEESLEKELESPDDDKGESQKPDEEKDLKGEDEKGEEEKTEEELKAEGEEDKDVKPGEYEKKFFENRPDLQALNINSFEDLENAYTGGLKGFETARRTLGELEKEIPDLKTEDGRKAFLEKVRAKGQDAIIPKTPAEEFKQSRRKTIAEGIPTQVRVLDPETGNPETFVDSDGEERYQMRDVTEEEKEKEVVRLEGEFNKIFPVKYVEQIHSSQNLSQRNFNDSQWRAYRSEALFDKLSQMDEFKDLIIPNERRAEIEKFFEDDDVMATKIVEKAIEDKKNHWKALNHVFTTMSKSDLIKAKRREVAEEKAEKKVEKEKSKRGESPGTGKKTSMVDIRAKDPSKLSLAEQERIIEAGG